MINAKVRGIKLITNNERLVYVLWFARLAAAVCPLAVLPTHGTLQ